MTFDHTKRPDFAPYPIPKKTWDGKQLFAFLDREYTKIGEKYVRHFDQIPNGKAVKVFHTGEISRIVTTHKGKCVIRNIGERQYAHISTGEVKDYSRTAKSRAENARGLATSFQHMRDMINTNFLPEDFTGKKALWVTLTYRECVTDYRQVEADFEAFKKRLKRIYGEFSYLNALEPMGKKAGHRWHVHVLLKWESKAPYIEELLTIWGHGWTKVNLAKTDNFGAYLSAYLTNMESENGELKSNGKKYLKGSRLSLYPPKMRPFRWSKDLKKPEVQEENMSQELRKSLGYRTFVTAREIECGEYKMIYGQEIFKRRQSDYETRGGFKKVTGTEERDKAKAKNGTQFKRPPACNSSGVSGRTGFNSSGNFSDGTRGRASGNLGGEFNPRHEKFFSFLNDSPGKSSAPSSRSSSEFSPEVLKKTSPISSAVSSSAARISAVSSSGFGCSVLAVPPQFVHRR